MTDTDIQQSLATAHHRMEMALVSAGRDPQGARLLAVSKTKPACMLREAWQHGQREFGENYVQEALGKQAELADLEGIIWHFIGPLQSNKSRDVAEHFDWVHSVDRIRLARRLNSQRPDSLAPLNVCIQVNVSGEGSKSGIALDALIPLAEQVLALPRLRLRGLMAIPAPAETLDAQRQPLAALHSAFIKLKKRFPDAPLDTLSMGMSSDLEAAIIEGSTLVRLGTAIFGARDNYSGASQ
ncbi:YggS family pyridoxal phosphate-dependent enzyme [Halomonas halocynthiae]|uniref:YggS family pyridoxal phosphate-dependent enzyme n=1 Tax=Halomonas halocynthiae TaxID=176290 RepID=UPI0004818CF4|nr:YggS family pyridoxal phosphate-dependent enzyme [Halomonas halocynthiae]